MALPTPTTYTLEQAEEDIATLRGQVDQLTEQLTQTDGGVVPNAPAIANSHAFYCSNGQPSWIDDTGLQMGVVGAQQAFAPGQTVTGTGLGNLAQWSIPASNAEPLAMYETEVWGYGTAGTSGAGVTLNLTTVLGGNNMAGVTLGATFFGSGSLFRFHTTVRAICHTTGAAGTWSSLIFGEVSCFNVNLLGGAGAQNTAGFVSCESTGLSTVDTTVGENLSLSASWGATTGSPSITSTVAIAKRWC